MRKLNTAAGATLLEILVAMMIIGLVATGIVTAFIFSRRITWRSGTELSGSGLVTEVAEALRGAVSGPITTGPNAGLNLNPGIYVDRKMANAGPFTGNNPPFIPPAGATPLAALDLPADFQKFQTSVGTAGATVAAANHGDGRVVTVERADENGNGIADEDLDGDQQIGLDLDGNGTTDLRRVRVRVKWTTPST